MQISPTWAPKLVHKKGIEYNVISFSIFNNLNIVFSSQVYDFSLGVDKPIKKESLRLVNQGD
jgi:hypothetical protein